jgi:hypothetical protein
MSTLLTQNQACDLVSTALSSLHQTPGIPFGYEAEDSAAIVRAEISPLDLEDKQTGQFQRMWLVQLTIPSKRYDVQVPISRITGAAELPQNVHKP